MNYSGVVGSAHVDLPSWIQAAGLISLRQLFTKWRSRTTQLIAI
jgi:hypothetical protein